MSHFNKVWNKMKEKLKCNGAVRSSKQKTSDTLSVDDVNFLDTVVDSYDGFLKQKGFIDVWVLEDYIAEGAFGIVRNVRGVKTKIQAVMKISDKTTILREYLAKKEALVMMALPGDSEYFPRILDYIETDDLVCIVMTKMKGQELGSVTCDDTNEDKLTESEAKDVIRQLMDCIMICHAHGVLHRDIKLDNVMWDRHSKQLSLIDFGVSSFMYNDQTTFHDAVGCITYASPGLLKLVNNNIPLRAAHGHADLWAIGVLTYGILTGFFPYKTESSYDLEFEIKNCNLHDLTIEDVSDECNNFIQILLDPQNEHKITASGMMSHPWLNFGGPLKLLGPYSVMDFTPKLYTKPAKLESAIREIETELHKGLKRFSRIKSGSSILSQQTLCES
jgi:serine/threonine protein kinase